jgi:viroplasmin and RNaseH domain-containing protein
MPLNVIDKNMIVKNKIELKPIVSFVSASLDCNNLNLLEVESAGVYGELDAKSIKLNKWKDSTTNTEYPRNFKIRESSLEILNEKNVNILNDSKFNNSSLNNLSEYEESLESKGIFFDRSGEYKFGVDRI